MTLCAFLSAVTGHVRNKARCHRTSVGITKSKYTNATVFPDTVLFPSAVQRQMVGPMAEVAMSSISATD